MGLNIITLLLHLGLTLNNMKNYYVTIGSDKVIWGTGKTPKQSEKDAKQTVVWWLQSWRHFGVRYKGDESRDLLARTLTYKTYLCSYEDYENICSEGTKTTTKYKILRRKVGNFLKLI